MSDLPTLEIKCEGTFTVSLDDITELQGNLKDLTEENYVRLRNSMTKYGFSFPLFIWESPEGTKFIVDAHQRVRTLRKMRSEGFDIPQLPAVRIQAKDRVEAKKKLLLLNSRYGTITREGFDEFIDEVGFEVPDDIEDLLVIPEIEIREQEDKTNANENTDLHEAVCPSCGTKFNI